MSRKEDKVLIPGGWIDFGIDVFGDEGLTGFSDGISGAGGDGGKGDANPRFLNSWILSL